MKTLHILTSLLLVITLLCTSFTSKASDFGKEKMEVNDDTKQVTLNAGTPIVVETLETYNAKNLSPGQVISVRVKFNIVVNKQVLVAAGALGTAIVSDIKKPKGFGKGGKMIINLQSIQSIDGQQILLSGNSYTLEGDHRKGLAWGVGAGAGIIGAVIVGSPVFLGVGILSGFAFKGSDAELKAGTTFNSYVASDTEIDLASDTEIGLNK